MEQQWYRSNFSILPIHKYCKRKIELWNKKEKNSLPMEKVQKVGQK